MENEIVEKLLKKGKDFDEYISSWRKENRPLISMFEGTGDDAFEQKDIIECLKESPFKETFEKLSNEDINATYLEYENKKRQMKKWLINSEVRARTFWLLGQHHPCSVKEIEEMMGRKDRNIYKALDQFEDKNLVKKVGDPQDRRVNLCHLTEIGDYFYSSAEKSHWFHDMFERQREIENTIIEIEYLYTIWDHDIKGEPIEDVMSYPDEYFPDIGSIIKEIKMLGFKFISNLNLEMQLPELTGQGKLIRINSTDEDKLAIIFASFNYLEKLRSGTDYPSIHRIKIIKTEDLFNAGMPDIMDNKGFMSGTETQDLVAKIMKKFKKKLSNNNRR